MCEQLQVSMDAKAANKGDRIKHALTLEVLDRCSHWEKIYYAETHSGAGIYQADAQEGEKNIERLRELVAASLPTSTAPGAFYLNLLKAWWEQPTRQNEYPGSVLQAVHFLIEKHRKQNCEFRVTEADPGAHRRLTEALKVYGIEPCLSGFQHQIKWLTEEDDLFLAVDPFAVVAASSCSDPEGCLNSGLIDIDTLLELLNSFPKKSRAVALIWTSYGHAVRVKKRAFIEEKLNCWAVEAAATLRKYHDNSNHFVYLLGFGEGTTVVNALPGKGSWKASWLSDTIYEL